MDRLIGETLASGSSHIGELLLITRSAVVADSRAWLECSGSSMLSVDGILELQSFPRMLAYLEMVNDINTSGIRLAGHSVT